MGKIVSFLRSKWFFIATLFIFSCEVIWLIFTNQFPMAFDESFHFGLINFFSHHLNPFVTTQPASTYGLGAISHNPSIFYHYLLSFPLRLIEVFSKSLKVQIIGLRLFSWLFALVSLIYSRKILSELKVPKALANLAILTYALTPIVSVLSAQINYDNLLILCTVLSIYLTIKLIQQIARQKLSSTSLLELLILCLFSSVVKFTFLPIFVGIILVVLIYLYKAYSHNTGLLATDLKNTYLSQHLLKRTLLVILLILGLGIFINYYGYNLIKYHNITPQCQQILTTQDCSNYYAWNRNNTVIMYQHAHPTTHYMSIISFTIFWFKVEYYQLFGEIIPVGGLVYIVKEFYGYIIFVSVLCTLAIVYTIKPIIKKHVWILPTLIICFLYLLALWFRNYTNYRQLGQPLAIQGRYLVPVLIYFYALAGLGMNYTFNKQPFKRIYARQIIAVVTIAVFIYFGGFVRYISVVTPKFGWKSSISTKPHYNKNSITD